MTYENKQKMQSSYKKILKYLLSEYSESRRNIFVYHILYGCEVSFLDGISI